MIDKEEPMASPVSLEAINITEYINTIYTKKGRLHRQDERLIPLFSVVQKYWLEQAAA